MNFGNKFHRNPNMLGNKQQMQRQLGNKFNYNGSAGGPMVQKKPDDSEGIVNESNNQDIHREPMGLSNAKKQNYSNLEKPKKGKYV